MASNYKAPPTLGDGTVWVSSIVVRLLFYCAKDLSLHLELRVGFSSVQFSSFILKFHYIQKAIIVK